ncbi:NADH:ubiquinone reductase (Na(+)-transporting) subunit F [Nitratireductor mangrovi]|uniref:Na(+)-translocating NADH-quinone reductase subunit F n=1 Tax=Nitratireductor mangrovi TaxID=2599600 RepID=A0A5B8L201_9HYPH|nr:NADH:ubiquinone reductase (Na(+)-transporting) subunit F [Nitratireductor mangrovi]QDZ01548.1 NADH:ubiquinone reductase (Na(+)-transporting) subunit F [Nitratireductor mangrovi]
MTEMVLGSALFVAIVLALSAAVLAARALLMPGGTAAITVNDRQELAAKLGEKLLGALNDGGIAVPSACGGAGTCGQCRVTVTEGGGEVLPNEKALFTRKQIAQGNRLACQVTVRGDVGVRVPDAVLNAREWRCTVVSSRTLAPLIRELALELPAGDALEFRPGSFVQVTAPAYRLSFADYDIAPEHRAAWERQGLGNLTSSSAERVSRAYSIANTPEHGDRRIMLLIRLALPPPDKPGVPPGVVSSWLFGLREGDRIDVSGPFGEFAAKNTDREMVFIGGGVGMAPLRAIITDQLQRVATKRKISFWYGARGKVDLFYGDEFTRLQAEHDNFTWTVALSDPAPNEQWSGETGFIHDVVLRRLVRDHPAPEACEYYLCGPPLMIKAVLAMLDDAGVDADCIFNDDFGS